jgi:hypothetical protein
MDIMWIAIIVAIVGFFALTWFFDGDRQRRREFENDLSIRESIDDEQFVHRFFSGQGIDPSIPTNVRRVFSEQMNYPRDKTLPDDDFMFYCRQDSEFLVEALQQEFGVSFNDKELEQTRVVSISTIANLIANNLAAKHAAKSANAT